MAVEERFNKVIHKVLERVVPRLDERVRVLKKVEEARSIVERKFRTFDPNIRVSVEGSVAKDTWLSGDVDADIFVSYPNTYDKSEIGKITISFVKKTFGKNRCIERYAEHPYVTVRLDGTISADVVPCFRVMDNRWMSATDRTPYHTAFIKERFNEELCNEARLLKRYMKGVGVYGAEIKVGGFSGYLAELLVYHFGGFREVLNAFSSFKPPFLIDFSASYTREEALAIFNGPLVVVDPTDRARNVASAVRDDTLWQFVMSSRDFLRAPSLRFFYPREISPPSKRELLKLLRSFQMCPLVVFMKTWERKPDILWGQMYKLERRLISRLEFDGFEVVTSKSWSDEDKYVAIAIILTSCAIPPGELKRGPEIFRSSSNNFLDKYQHSTRRIYGPFTRDGRLYVLRKRKHSDVVHFLRAIKSDEEFLRGLPVSARRCIRDANFLIGFECASLAGISGCAVFLKKLLLGKPPWKV
jgi:tRNA nucleotidyltransferase (CCA-adding enzyme)